MKLEETEAQCILWRKLNAIIMKKGVANPNVKGFMANNAQTNWNVISIIYGIKDLTMKLINK
jgi:hypothetical protein